MNQNREPIFSALFTLLGNAATFKTKQRRFKELQDFNADTDFPVLIVRSSIMGAGEENTRQGEGLPGRTTLMLSAIIYTNSGEDPAIVPETELNNLLDAVDVAMRPDDLVSGKLTLGGLVSNCWVEGEIVKVPGDIDGKGFAVVPIRISVP